MTEIAPPPPGYEVLEVEGDPDGPLNPADLRFLAPDGSVVTFDELYGDDTLEEAADVMPTGIMVALYPPAEVATKLALEGGLPPDELHVTLAFLGKTTEHGEDPGQTEEIVRAWAAQTPELEGQISGLGYFHGNPDSPDGVVTYASVDLAALPHSREALVEALVKSKTPAYTNHGFTPHMTLAYGNRRPKLDLPMDVCFDRVVLAWGTDRYSFVLGGKA